MACLVSCSFLVVPLCLQININRKEVGQQFKKDAKAATEALENMSECDAMELKVRQRAGGSSNNVIEESACR